MAPLAVGRILADPIRMAVRISLICMFTLLDFF